MPACQLTETFEMKPPLSLASRSMATLGSPGKNELEPSAAAIVKTLSNRVALVVGGDEVAGGVAGLSFKGAFVAGGSIGLWSRASCRNWRRWNRRDPLALLAEQPLAQLWLRVEVLWGRARRAAWS